MAHINPYNVTRSESAFRNSGMNLNVNPTGSRSNSSPEISNAQIQGVVLAVQTKCLNWKARGVQCVESVPASAIEEVQAKSNHYFCRNYINSQ